MKIKIIGCGSAGNHIAYAFKSLSNDIVMSDVSLSALKRSKNKIYKKRYKIWNKNIHLKIEKNDKKTNYDAIIISSPPSTHLELIKKNILKTNTFLIEKPICEPSSKTITDLKKIIKEHREKTFLCGYNHRLFPSTLKLKSLIDNGKYKPEFIKVNFKEGTDGFLKAHFWFKNLRSSYLSKTKLGGGSLCEHSHALNLAQFFINDDRRLNILHKDISKIKSGSSYYDNSSKILFKTFDNKIIEINQDFETTPTEKTITIIGKNFYSKLTYNSNANNDHLIFCESKKKKKEIVFKKKRSDDFKYEADYLKKIVNLKKNKKLIKILDAKNGIYTMENIVKIL